MQINISARHGHLSPATQEKITEKNILVASERRVSTAEFVASVVDAAGRKARRRLTVEHHRSHAETKDKLMSDPIRLMIVSRGRPCNGYSIFRFH